MLLQSGAMSAPIVQGGFLGNAALLKSTNGARTVMVSATKIVKKAQKAAKSAARNAGYKKFDGVSSRFDLAN